MLTLCHNYFRVQQNNKNSKDGVQNFNTKQFVFGVFILLLVVVLWVASSEMTKFLYVDKHLERPFLVTYVRSSLLIVYLIVLCFSPPTRDPCRPSDYTQLLEPTAETDDENYFNEATNSLGDSTFVPVRAGETTDSDDATPRAVRFNKVAEVRVMSAAMAGEALLARLSWAASVRASEHAQRKAAAAATRRHLRLAFYFCAPWFISNYLYRLSLLHTTTSSATIYTSTSGAFAITLGALFTQVPTDRFTLSKCIAVLLTAAGLVVLGITESHQSNWTAVLAALGSAFCYAIHLLMFRHELRKGDGINSPLLVGLVGCASLCVWWWVGGALWAAGGERGEAPPARLCAWLLLDAALAPLLQETLWLWYVLQDWWVARACACGGGWAARCGRRAASAGRRRPRACAPGCCSTPRSRRCCRRRCGYGTYYRTGGLREPVRVVVGGRRAVGGGRRARGGAARAPVRLAAARRRARAAAAGDAVAMVRTTGLVGCASLCVWWWVGGALWAAGGERGEAPPARLCAWLLLDAALAPLLQETLWLWGRSLTSPQTATGMLGLAVPLGACVEAWRGAGGGAAAWRALAAVLAGAGWAAAALHLPRNLGPITCITNRLRAAEGFSVLRNISELDEQSEALMSSDEPT